MHKYINYGIQYELIGLPLFQAGVFAPLANLLCYYMSKLYSGECLKNDLLNKGYDDAGNSTRKNEIIESRHQLQNNRTAIHSRK